MEVVICRTLFLPVFIDLTCTHNTLYYKRHSTRLIYIRIPPIVPCRTLEDLVLLMEYLLYLATLDILNLR
jgi:hypothetical protein